MTEKIIEIERNKHRAQKIGPLFTITIATAERDVTTEVGYLKASISNSSSISSQTDNYQYLTPETPDLEDTAAIRR